MCEGDQHSQDHGFHQLSNSLIITIMADYSHHNSNTSVRSHDIYYSKPTQTVPHHWLSLKNFIIWVINPPVICRHKIQILHYHE